MTPEQRTRIAIRLGRKLDKLQRRRKHLTREMWRHKVQDPPFARELEASRDRVDLLIHRVQRAFDYLYRYVY